MGVESPGAVAVVPSLPCVDRHVEPRSSYPERCSPTRGYGAFRPSFVSVMDTTNSFVVVGDGGTHCANVTLSGVNNDVLPTPAANMRPRTECSAVEHLDHPRTKPVRRSVGRSYVSGRIGVRQLMDCCTVRAHAISTDCNDDND